MNRKRLIIIILIVLLVSSIVTAILLTQSGRNTRTTSSNTPAATLKTDKDTGEQLVTDPSLAQSETTDSGGTVILGLPDLIDSANLLTQQSDFVNTQLTTYATQNLKDKYATLTIQPEHTTVNGDTITTTIRLGDGTTTINMHFESGTNSGTMQLFITDPNNTGGGNYTSPATTLAPQ